MPVSSSPVAQILGLVALLAIASLRPPSLRGQEVSSSDGPSAEARSPRLSPDTLALFESRIRPVLAERCYKCHSARAKLLKAGLSLESREGMLAGGDSGPAIVPGKPEESRLVLALQYRSADLEMPPDGKLSGAMIEDFERWVRLGAPWPPEAEPGAPAAKESSYDWEALRRGHWAFRPVLEPEVPAVDDASWPRNAVDRFILSTLEAHGMTPSPEAEPRALIRRVHLDLIGLPPSPEEVEAFLADTRPDAYERLVERLLASPHHGERWARHWLDVARYSDGFGTGFDGGDYPTAFRYRDWVVDALNADLPYDDFVRYQVAADAFNAPPEATGFLALGPTYKDDGGDPESIAKAQADTLEDRMDTTFRGFMGLTIACARCHDHKFDPIPTADYYSVAAAFQNTRTVDVPIVPQDVVKRFHDHQSAMAALDGEIKKLLEERSKAAGGPLSEAQEQELAHKQAELEELKRTAPPSYPTAHAVADSGDADMPIALRGDLRKPGPIAPRRFPRILAGENPPQWKGGSGRRQLAEAIASPQNPLTPRVIVNRIWLHHFGKGLVRTPSNFGRLGQEPTHPALLDWLAARLVGSGWSLKALHRTILLSSTYRMSTAYREDHDRRDGDNRLLWRMSPRRVEAEVWRDNLLVATGELDLRLGGEPTQQLLQSSRRSLYATISRNGDRFESDQLLQLFDFPAARITSPQRNVSIVPQQYLFLLNSPFMIERAGKLAARLGREAADDDARVERAYALLYARRPTSVEKRIGLDYIGGGSDPSERWRRYAQALLCAHETSEIP